MQKGRIEGSLVGASRDVFEWRVAAKGYVCGCCGNPIEEFEIYLEHKIFEAGRFNRGYRNCRVCAEKTGRVPPKSVESRRRQRSLFLED